MLITRCRAIHPSCKSSSCEQAHIGCLSTCLNIARRNAKNPVTHGYISTHHRTIFILMKLLMNNLRYVFFYIIFIAYKAPICLVFVMFFTHFKWSKCGLNPTTTLSRTLEKPRKIKHFTDVAKAVLVYCRGSRKALVSYKKLLS